MDDTILHYLLLCFMPCLSLLYAVSVLVFKVSSWECQWTDMTAAVVARLTGLVACLSVAASLDDGNGRTKSDAPAFLTVFVVVMWVLVANTVSVYGILRVRSVYVVGPTVDLPPHCMDDRVVLVTGANAGIGFETSKHLLELGATVVFACRSEKRARDAMDDLARCVPGDRADVQDRMRFLQLDLSDLSSVRQAVDTFHHKMRLPLHVLINNAGLMSGAHRFSADGLELTMACNHLGHFLLTQLLLPKLRQEQDARVVVVGSSLYAVSTTLDVDDLFCARHRAYHWWTQYSQSKLANLLYARELARREDGVVAVHALHPGVVRTDVANTLAPWLVWGNRLFARVIATLQKTPAQGAYTSVHCAASPGLAHGKWYANTAEAPLEACARDDEAAKRLWDISSKLVGI